MHCIYTYTYTTTQTRHRNPVVNQPPPVIQPIVVMSYKQIQQHNENVHGATDWYAKTSKLRSDCGSHTGPNHLLSGIDTVPLTKQLRML